MPLSEQEQRLLEEMERSLYHNDADYVASVSSGRTRPSYSAVAVGILIAIVGVAVLVTGVIVRVPVVGVIGFIFMFVGVLRSVTPPRTGLGGEPHAAGKRSFSRTLSERWQQRQHKPEE